MVEAVGSVRVIPIVASGGSFLGFLAACFLLIYPDLEPSSSEQDEDSVGLPGVEDQNAENTSEQTQALLKLTNTDTETESLNKMENHSSTWAWPYKDLLRIMLIKQKSQDMRFLPNASTWFTDFTFWTFLKERSEKEKKDMAES